MFFSLLDQIAYDTRTVIDISKRANIIKKLLANDDLYFRYQLKNGDKPETVAYDFYGDAIHSWIIILVNEVYDPFYDWYMTEEELIAYAKLEYGDPGYLTGIKYYVDVDNVKYKETGAGRTPVTNIDYERIGNDAKQVVKIVYPQYKEQILAEYKQIIKN